MWQNGDVCVVETDKLDKFAGEPCFNAIEPDRISCERRETTEGVGEIASGDAETRPSGRESSLENGGKEGRSSRVDSSRVFFADSIVVSGEADDDEDDEEEDVIFGERNVVGERDGG